MVLFYYFHIEITSTLKMVPGQKKGERCFCWHWKWIFY